MAEMRSKLIEYIRENALAARNRRYVRFNKILGDPEALALSGQLLGSLATMDEMWASPRKVTVVGGSTGWAPLVYSLGLAWRIPMFTSGDEGALLNGVLPFANVRIDGVFVIGHSLPRDVHSTIVNIEETYGIRFPRVVGLVDIQDGSADDLAADLQQIGTEVRYLLTMDELQ